MSSAHSVCECSLSRPKSSPDSGALLAESDRAGRGSPEAGLASSRYSLAVLDSQETTGNPHTKCRDCRPLATTPTRGVGMGLSLVVGKLGAHECKQLKMQGMPLSLDLCSGPKEPGQSSEGGIQTIID